MASNLSTAQFEELWDVIHTARPTTKAVKVSKDALEGLLIDYGQLYSVVEERGDTNSRWRRT